MIEGAAVQSGTAHALAAQALLTVTAKVAYQELPARCEPGDEGGHCIQEAAGVLHRGFGQALDCALQRALMNGRGQQRRQRGRSKGQLGLQLRKLVLRDGGSEQLLQVLLAGLCWVLRGRNVGRDPHVLGKVARLGNLGRGCAVEDRLHVGGKGVLTDLRMLAGL